MERPQDRKVEPLFAALGDDAPARSDVDERSDAAEPSGAAGQSGAAERAGAVRSSFLWKLVVAALVFAGLLAVVLHQAF